MQRLSIKETLALLRMGHSEQAIMDYIKETPEAQPEPQPEPQPEAQPEPQPEAQPEPQPEAQPEAQPEPRPVAQSQAPGTELDRLYNKLAELTSAIQAGNRAAVDMSANIIDPMQAGRDALAHMGNMVKEERK